MSPDERPLGSASSRRSAEHGFTSRQRFAEHGFTSPRRFAEHGFTSPRRFAEHGFTLIEVMVALAVFSLAVLALIRLEGATARGASVLDETLVANLVARNVAADAVTDGRIPAAGRTAGVEANAGRGWRWVRNVQPTGDARIVRIDVAVTGPGGNVAGHATMVRPPTPEAPAPVSSPIPAPTPTGTVGG